MSGRSIAWKLFACIEFAGTILVCAVLYVGAALYFSVQMYLTALSGSLERAITLWRISRWRHGEEVRDVSGGGA